MFPGVREYHIASSAKPVSGAHADDAGSIKSASGASTKKGHKPPSLLLGPLTSSKKPLRIAEPSSPTQELAEVDVISSPFNVSHVLHVNIDDVYSYRNSSADATPTPTIESTPAASPKTKRRSNAADLMSFLKDSRPQSSHQSRPSLASSKSSSADPKKSRVRWVKPAAAPSGVVPKHEQYPRSATTSASLRSPIMPQSTSPVIPRPPPARPQRPESSWFDDDADRDILEEIIDVYCRRSLLLACADVGEQRVVDVLQPGPEGIYSRHASEVDPALSSDEDCDKVDPKYLFLPEILPLSTCRRPISHRWSTDSESSESSVSNASSLSSPGGTFKTPPVPPRNTSLRYSPSRTLVNHQRKISEDPNESVEDYDAASMASRESRVFRERYGIDSPILGSGNMI
ncbi:uncharacterized protein V1518DRAFT_414011 [Limtongia smithiae]|uniref:uncharacterized protein n=1 Tax=Limtongia smithiae TaxID=1125753 RepID=UPI0034CFA224